MVKPEFIIKTMRQNNIRFFDVYDADFHRQTEQFSPIGVEEAIGRFEDFLDGACTGYYRVNIYKTNEMKANGEPKGKAFAYEMYLDDSRKPAPTPEPEPVAPVSAPVPQQNMGFQGIHEPMQNIFTQGGMMGGVGLDQYLNEKNTILELRLRIQQLEMENRYLQDQMQRKESELRAEMDRQNSSEQRIQGIINNVLPTFMAGFAGQSPMNGIPESQPMDNNNHQTEKQQVINAVNRLMQLDPNFAKNIAALAVLAEKKPDVYAMAVKYLNGL